MSDYASTKDQFNPRNDPDVWAQNLVTSEKLDGGYLNYKVVPTSENFVWTPRNEKQEGLNRELDIQDGKRRFGATPTAAINALQERNKNKIKEIDKEYFKDRNADPKNYSVGQTLPYYSTPESAKRAAPYANQVSYVGGKNPKYDKLDAVGQVLQPGDTMGYVPKAEKVADATRENYLNSPSVQKTLQGTRERNAAREAANSPADMAAYRAKTFAKEAARAKAAGDTRAAERWQQSAAEESTKARQLGYKGDITKATIKDPTAKPQSPASTASTSKPAAPPTGQKTSGIDWDMTPPKNATEEAMRQNDMAIKKANADAVKKSDDKVVGAQMRKDMSRMDAEQKKITGMKSQFETNDQIKKLKGEVESDRKAEQNWKDKAAKATDPARKEHALQMAAEYADKARKREAEIASLGKNSKVPDIKPLSKNKDAKIPKTPTDPMGDLMAGIPVMNNSSAYNTSGAGGGSGVAGFFTRDGKVIPITA